MRVVRLVLLGAIAALFPTGLSAQQSVPAPVRDTQAIALVQQSLQAMGGAQLASLQDCQASGTYQLLYPQNQPPEPIVVKSRGSNRVHIEVQTPAGTRSRILNQGRAAIETPDGKVKRLLSQNTVGERVSYIPLFSLLSEWQLPSTEIRFIGPTTVNGQAAVEIAISSMPTTGTFPPDLMRTLTETHFFIDSNSGLVLKMSYKLYAENHSNRSQNVDVVYGDYKPISGVEVPFRQDAYIEGHLWYEVLLTSVSFNTGLADSDFNLPN